jgi:plasmid maintenance system antidote protein VapI
LGVRDCDECIACAAHSSMDPLSISAAAVAIATRCVITGKTIYDTAEKLQSARQRIRLIVDTIDITQSTLLVIDNHLRTSGSQYLPLHHRNSLQRAIKSFEDDLICLEEEFTRLTKHPSWRSRVKTVWREEIIQMLLNSFQHRHTLLQTLLQSLQL